MNSADPPAVNAGAPQMWIHGIESAPEKAKALDAVGIRGIYDLHKVNREVVEQLIARYNQNGQGMALTVRWEEGRDARGRAKFDVPPSTDDAETAIDSVISVLKSAPAQQMADAGKLWIQFYNEIAGGPGTFRPEQADALFGFATRAARRIRSECPKVLICGPAIMRVDVLDSPALGANLAGTNKERYDLMNQAIAWSAANADAMDVHLHVDSGATADRSLKTVRRLLDAQPNGHQCKIVSWEWSPARYPDRNNLEGARKAEIDIYRAMAANHVFAAAYSEYWVPKSQPEVFKWVTLVDENGNPREPFYSLFKDMADGKISPTGTDYPPPSAPFSPTVRNGDQNDTSNGQQDGGRRRKRDRRNQGGGF